MHPEDLTLFRVMRRPRWIAVLVIALLVAAAFAWLGKWQLSRAVAAREVGPQVTETSHPLVDMLKPGIAIQTKRVGQLVTVTATMQPHDYALLSNRQNQGASGYWIVGHARANGAELAVARGFTSSRKTALAELAKLDAQPATTVHLSGRLLPTEPPEQPEDNQDGTPPVMQDMSVATLINVWQVPAQPKVYEAYLVAHDDIPSGLTAIYSPSPLVQRSIDWLNAFYAVEWAVFAGFAIYLWYRLAKDTWEREIEDAELALEQGADDPGAAEPHPSEKVD